MKLKLHMLCPFHGHGESISYLVPLLISIESPLLIGLTTNPIPCFSITAIITVIVSYLFCNRLNENEKQLIASAPPLDWQPADLLLRSMRNKNKTIY